MNSLSSDCLFCKIIEGKIPCQKIFENKVVLAFKDIQPQAPVHILLVPKSHFADALEASQSNAPVFEPLFQAASEVAQQLGLSEKGFRLVFNTKEHACQSVFHLHLHLLGGAQLGGSMVG